MGCQTIATRVSIVHCLPLKAIRSKLNMNYDMECARKKFVNTNSCHWLDFCTG